MPDLVPEHGLAAWRGFLKAHAAVLTRIEEDLTGQGLVALTWYDVLIAVSSAAGEHLRMRDLADELVLTRSRATRLVDKLEAAGLVRRDRCDDDGRGSEASLTAAGKHALRDAWPVYARGINELFLAPLSEQEKRVLASALTRVASRSRGREAGSQTRHDL